MGSRLAAGICQLPSTTTGPPSLLLSSATVRRVGTAMALVVLVNLFVVDDLQKRRMENRFVRSESESFSQTSRKCGNDAMELSVTFGGLRAEKQGWLCDDAGR